MTGFLSLASAPALRLARRTAAAWIAAAALAPAVAQQNFDAVQVRTEKLNATTYVLFGAGGNIGVSVGDDAVFVIDDQFAPLTPKIKDAISKLSRKPVQFVLNTHWHFDHTGGNENFGKEGTLIVAHDNVRKRMNSDQLIAFLKMPVPASPKAALPVVTFSTDATFHINGDEIRAIHVPNAHTDGDTIVHFVKSDVIHMGDTYFNGFYPFIDVSSGGTADGVVAAADRVLGMAGDSTKIIPGHGAVSNRTELKAYRDLVATVAQRIKDLRKAGKSDADIIAERPAKDYDAKYGNGFIKSDRFIEMMLAAVPK